MTEKSTLYVVATPIGNLQDMTHRAIDVLQHVGLIVAEDTRHSRKLLDHFSISSSLMSLHQHNEHGRAQQVIERLRLGDSVALISDAGTPAISDPGYLLVRSVSEAGFVAKPIPGASSLVAALSVAGLPADKFTFCGFLPSKSGQRQTSLEAVKHVMETLVFFEAPHRILACLADLQEILGANRQIMVGREMCKLFESYYRGTASEVIKHLTDHKDEVCGEFVVCVSGASAAVSASHLEASAQLKILLPELPLSRAVKVVTKLSGLARSEVYDLALTIAGKV